MYLVGDIGNSEVKICLFSLKNKLKKKIIIKTCLISTRYVEKKLSFLKNKKIKINKILFCSVVPNSYKIIKNYIQKVTNVKSFEIKEKNLSKFLKIEVNKKQIGSDRVANAISVIDNKKNYIIIDFGTATTFDVVIKNNYMGGIIAPGVKLSLNTLISKASLIPIINLKRVKNIIGKNTKSAVRSGFFWGYTGLINNILSLISKQTKKNYNIILTGGLSYLFKNSLFCKVSINKDLTIQGLLKIIRILK